MSDLEPPADYPQFAGRWIALIRGEIITHGGSPDQVSAAAYALRHKEKADIRYVPLGRPLNFPPILPAVVAALPPDQPVFIAGGAVRDAYLQRPIHDMDFVMKGDALAVARRVADQIGAAYYPLDEERGTARVVVSSPGAPRMVLDFATLRATDLDGDLFSRDFTINAMAVSARSTQELIDPTGGVADLQAKIIRACSTRSIKEDPLRILRGVRLAAVFGLRIHPDTRELIRAGVPGLAKVSRERRRDELFRIFESPHPSVSIQALDIFGALRYLLPEMDALKGVEQSPPHISDVWKHTLDALQKLEIVLEVLNPANQTDLANNLMMGMLVMQLGRFRSQIISHMSQTISSDRPVRSLLFLAALYHDIAKPVSRSVDENGRVRFFGHDEQGAQMASARMRRLRMSSGEAHWLSLVVRHHLRPFLLVNAGGSPSRRAIYRFFRDAGDAGVDICLLALADVLATYGPTLTADVWARHLEITGMLLDAWWNHPAEAVTPPVLINGRELMDELGLLPGPKVGRLLADIREAQAEGIVQTREQALDFARSHLEDQNLA